MTAHFPVKTWLLLCPFYKNLSSHVPLASFVKAQQRGYLDSKLQEPQKQL